MRAHVIKDDKIVNTIEVDALDVFPGLVDAALGGVIGDGWVGGKPVPAPLIMPTETEYVASVQSMLDAKARERRYDGILSACTYATSLNERFQAEGQACVEWRDAVWARCYDLLGQVNSGTIPQPTLADLLAMLPALEWPA